MVCSRGDRRLDRIDPAASCVRGDARADFLRQLGRNAEARIAFGRALALTDNQPERRFLAGRMLELRPRSNADWEEFWTHTLNDLKETLQGGEGPPP